MKTNKQKIKPEQSMKYFYMLIYLALKQERLLKLLRNGHRRLKGEDLILKKVIFSQMLKNGFLNYFQKERKNEEKCYHLIYGL